MTFLFTFAPRTFPSRLLRDVVAVMIYSRQLPAYHFEIHLSQRANVRVESNYGTTELRHLFFLHSLQLTTENVVKLAKCCLFSCRI